MRLISERKKQTINEDLSARPNNAKRAIGVVSGPKTQKSTSPSKDKQLKNGAVPTAPAVYTIKKKPTATGLRSQTAKGAPEASLGKRNPLDIGGISLGDLNFNKKAKPGEKPSIVMKHNLATIVKSELQTPKEGVDFFYLNVYKRLDKALGQNLQPPKVDLLSLRK